MGVRQLAGILIYLLASWYFLVSFMLFNPLGNLIMLLAGSWLHLILINMVVDVIKLEKHRVHDQCYTLYSYLSRYSGDL